MSKAFVTQQAPPIKADAVVNEKFVTFDSADYNEFSNQAETFKKLGCEVVGCSCDSKYTHLAWIQTPRKKGGLGKMNIPLISDLSKSISRDYGVLLPEGVALRGLFLIDPKMNIRHITINDLPIGRSIEECLRVLQACQFTDEHGEVCPMNWKPGRATIKPTPEEKNEFFSKQ